MKLAGYEGIRKHLPDYTDVQAKKIVALLPATIIMVVAFQMIAYRIVFPVVLPSVSWILPFIFNAVFVLGGSVLAQTGFRKRVALRAIDKERAYQRVVKPVLMGIGTVIGGIVFGTIPQTASVTETTTFLSRSLLHAFLPAPLIVQNMIFALQLVSGTFILVCAILCAMRAVQSFGIDTASLVYVYFPEEARIVDNKIYSVLRHPMYFTVFALPLGSLIIQTSCYSIVFLAITWLTFVRHIRIEENELVERFGNGYVEYSQRVPAIFIPPKHWKAFFYFIFKTPSSTRDSTLRKDG